VQALATAIAASWLIGSLTDEAMKGREEFLRPMLTGA
jgi:hypothetical protein